MSDLMGMLGGLSGNQALVGKVAGMLGGDTGKAQNAIGAALPALLGGVADQAGDPNRAPKLAAALQRDHDGGLLDDPGSAFDRSVAPGGDRSTDGAGIVNHLFGAKRAETEQQVARAAGIDVSQAGSLLAGLAPMVMGVLGKSQSGGGGLDLASIAGLLQGGAGGGGVGGLKGMLDTDRDGKVGAKDVGGLKGIVSKLLGSRRR